MAAPVVIVVPPFSNIGFPALGPSTLVAMCQRSGVDGCVLYANLEFAAQVGVAVYQRISSSSIHALLGEAIFQNVAFGSETSSADHMAAVQAIVNDPDNFPTSGGVSPVSSSEVVDCVRQVEPFIDACARRILSSAPQIVGFSSVFQQNLSSIALARRIKQLAPNTVTVLGGGNASVPMGRALSSTTEVFDYIFSGEADVEFPRFCTEYLDHDTLPTSRVIECEPVFELDRIAVPDYSDYFQQLEARLDAGTLDVEHRAFSFVELPYWLPIETSRGCWYGAKKHCTFCGLNGLEIRYRRKSSERTVDEFKHLAKLYGVRRFQASDNIMPHDFTKSVLPALAEHPERLELFYEVKANLKESDLDHFVLAGVTNIQPGIESLSSNVLRHMAKGVSALQNLRLLRGCASRDIHVSWNVLTGVPGETAADYEALLTLLPKIEHLQPPYGHGILRIDRFSPYYSDPHRFGIRSIQPFDAYRRLYPESSRLSELAYHFGGDYSTEFLLNDDLRNRLGNGLDRWQARWRDAVDRPLLVAAPLENGRLQITDSRSAAVVQTLTLPRAMSETLLALEAPMPIDKARAVHPELQILVDRMWVVEHEGFYISVVTRPDLGVQLRRQWSRRAWRHPAPA